MHPSLIGLSRHHSYESNQRVQFLGEDSILLRFQFYDLRVSMRKYLQFIYVFPGTYTGDLPFHLTHIFTLRLVQQVFRRTPRSPSVSRQKDRPLILTIDYYPLPSTPYVDYFLSFLCFNLHLYPYIINNKVHMGLPNRHPCQNI